MIDVLFTEDEAKYLISLLQDISMQPHAPKELVSSLEHIRSAERSHYKFKGHTGHRPPKDKKKEVTK